MNNVVKISDILATNLSVLIHNYFNDLIKLFLDLAKYLDT